MRSAIACERRILVLHLWLVTGDRELGHMLGKRGCTIEQFLALVGWRWSDRCRSGCRSLCDGRRSAHERAEEQDLADADPCRVFAGRRFRLCPGSRADQLYEGGHYRTICLDHGADESGKACDRKTASRPPCRALRPEQPA